MVPYIKTEAIIKVGTVRFKLIGIPVKGVPNVESPKIAIIKNVQDRDLDCFKPTIEEYTALAKHFKQELSSVELEDYSERLFYTEIMFRLKSAKSKKSMTFQDEVILEEIIVGGLAKAGVFCSLRCHDAE